MKRHHSSLLLTAALTAAAMLLLCAPTASARQVISWNEGWQFKRGPFSTEPQALAAQWQTPWDSVSLPHTWNARDMQTQPNRFYQGPAYYRKTFNVGGLEQGRRYFLRFEGVGSCAEVYLNNRLVGCHRGAYTAFAVELTGAIRWGAPNHLLVKADNQARPDVIPVNHQLFGVYGGIYRPVWLIITEGTNIAVTDHASPGVYIEQSGVSARQADVRIRVKLDNGTLRPASVELQNTIYTRDGRRVAEQTLPINLTPQGTQTYSMQLRIKHPHLWQGREDPYLYRVVTRLMQKGCVIDEQVQPLGLRHYELIAGKGFYLNGKKYPMYGVTRHQDWWQLGSALTPREHDIDLDMIMDIGATTIRLAHYPQSDYVYSRCDSLGLIVWAEIPFVNRVTGHEWENAHAQLRELIRQAYNHPSIYCWGLHNEVYSPTDYTAQLTRSLHDLAKTEDPSRLTAAVNGYGTASHPVNQEADIQGMNRYFGWYEKKISDMEPWVENLEKQYPWQRLMLTEYGADANLKHQTELLGESLNWGIPYYPETYQTKMHEQQWAVISRHPYILASYLWNMFDFACPMWERGGIACRNLKGLVTFDRKTKKDAYFWYKANWSSRPVLYITQRRNQRRERRLTTVTVYSNRGCPRLWLNGKPLPPPRQGLTAAHWVTDSISLSDGDNVIRAAVTDADSTLTDEVRWTYSGPCDRSPARSAENRSEHAGF